MKKRFLPSMVSWFLCLLLLTGCQAQGTPNKPDIDPSTSVLDFGRYYLKDMDLFLQDYGLSIEDFTPTSPCNYDSSKPLPFLNTEATYQLCCNEENQVAWVNIWFETAAEASADFEQIRYFRDYFNGQEGALFLNDLEEFQSKGPNLTTYQTPEEFEAAIREYADTPEEERTNPDFSRHVFSLLGFWNLAGDTQVQMGYRLSLDAQRGMIYLIIRNTKADFAMQRDGTLITPENASLLPQPPAVSEEEPQAEAPALSPDSTPQAFHWSLPGNAMKQASGFEAREGSRVSISLSASPAAAVVKVGIIDSTGKREYVTGEDPVSSIFSIPSDGTYHIFVENPNTEPIEVEGIYSLL